MSETESGETDGSGHGSPPTGGGGIPHGRLFLLNARRLQLKKIVEGLELPTAGSADELIEGTLEEGHDAHNVQVVVNEAMTVNVTLTLVDEEGVFLEVELFQGEVQESSECEETLQ